MGLVIVDEEHRFGVQQKIRAFAQAQSHPAEYLAMSATPIPRTLRMALSGLRDVSVIATPPYGRRPVRTLCFQAVQIKQQIKHELARGTSLLHPQQLKGSQNHRTIKTLPHATVRAAHGQMDRKQRTNWLTLWSPLSCFGVHLNRKIRSTFQISIPLL